MNNINEVFPINENTYNKNLKVFKRRYPQYIEKLEKTKLNDNYFTFRTGKKQTINLYSKANDSFYYKIDDPIKDAKDNIDKLDFKSVGIVLMFGIGLSYEVDYFAKKILMKNQVKGIIIFEKEWEIFKTTLHYIDLTQLLSNEKILLVIGEKNEALLPIVENYMRSNLDLLVRLKNIKPAYHIANFHWFKEYYMDILKSMKDIIVYVTSFFGNDPDDSLIGLENMLDNMNEIIENPGINLLYDKFKGKPAVIVSTGPSLNKNKHLLKELENKALIIAPDASLKVLLGMGVKPHMITALERLEMTATMIEGYTEDEVKDVYYTAAPVVPNIAYQSYPGPRIIVYRNFDHFKWIDIDKGLLEIKHSSGNMAFKIADALGCDPIILIGQDLSYSRDGKTHAKGSLLGENQNLPDNDFFEVQGNDGMPIRTNKTWNLFRQAYEIDVLATSNRCINSTEGGAYIRGTEVMPFKDAIERYVTDVYNPLDIIKENIGLFTEDDKKKDREKLVGIFNNGLNDLDKMIEESKKALELISENADRIKKDLKNNEVDKEYIDKIFFEVVERRRIVFTLQPTVQLLVMHVFQSVHIKYENDLNELPQKHEGLGILRSEVLLILLKWFAFFHDIVNLIRTLLIETKDNMEKN